MGVTLASTGETNIDVAVDDGCSDGIYQLSIITGKLTAFYLHSNTITSHSPVKNKHNFSYLSLPLVGINSDATEDYIYKSAMQKGAPTEGNMGAFSSKRYIIRSIHAFRVTHTCY